MTQQEPVNRMNDVDRTADPNQYLDYLDQVAARESTKAFKQHTFALMRARENARLLDVGCGAGDDVRALAQVAGPGGRVVGVDSSEVLIAEARKRSVAQNPPVEFQVMSVYQLDFADNTFNAARADRVFMHLDNPARALAEMYRVVAPDGFVVVDDPDWETFIVDASDRAVTRKILNHAVDGVVNGWIGRQLAGLFNRQGFKDVAVEAKTNVITNLGEAMQDLGLRMHANNAREAGIVTADEAARWLDDLQERDKAGCFFCAVTGFTIIGQKRC